MANHNKDDAEKLARALKIIVGGGAALLSVIVSSKKKAKTANEKWAEWELKNYGKS